MVVCTAHIAMHYYIDVCTFLENVWDADTENNN